MDRRSFLKNSPAAATATLVGGPSQAAVAGLIDADAVRASLPRLFTGCWLEVLGELMQNSQRAHAKHVAVTCREQGDKVVLEWSDDGHGIDGTDDSFRKLLAIGASGWDDEVRRNQSPLGLGLHALLAQEDVRRVTILGGGRAITIERDRWWTDAAYYSQWQKLIKNGACTKGLILQVVIKPADNNSSAESLILDVEALARGYTDLLQVTLNGRILVPMPEKIHEDAIHTEYQGCPVRIELCGVRHYTTSQFSINWYGQLITAAGGGEAYLADVSSLGRSGYGLKGEITITVREGTPFDMLSPSRRGVVNNAKWQQFRKWCGQEWLAATARAGRVPTEQEMQQAWILWPELRTKMPWCVVRAVEPTGVQSRGSVVTYEQLKDCIVLGSSEVTISHPDGDADTYDETSLRQPCRSATAIGEVMPAEWQSRLRVIGQTCDPDRLAIRQLHIDLSGERDMLCGEPDGMTGIHGYPRGEIQLLDLDGNVTDRRELKHSVGLPTERVSWGIRDATGFALVRPGDADYASVLWAFYDTDGEERSDEAEASFGRTIAEWIHERVGGDSEYLHQGSRLRELLDKLESGDTLTKAYNGNVCIGFEIKKANGDTRIVRVLDDV